MPSAILPGDVRGEVAFENVGFRYEAEQAGRRCKTSPLRPVPANSLRLSARPGAGKTTLTYLIPRLYDVNRDASP